MHACNQTAICPPGLPFNHLHPRNPCNCYSFTDPGGMEGWVDLVGWPIAYTLPTKWSSVNQTYIRKSWPAKDRRPNHWATPPSKQKHTQVSSPAARQTRRHGCACECRQQALSCCLADMLHTGHARRPAFPDDCHPGPGRTDTQTHTYMNDFQGFVPSSRTTDRQHGTVC